MLSRIISRTSNQIRQISTTKINYQKKIYTPSEEWLLQNNNLTQIGITKNAVEQLGEIVYIEFLHNKGDFVKKDEELLIIESVKATESIKAPFDNIINENNIQLEDDLSELNQDPENTWMIEIEKPEIKLF